MMSADKTKRTERAIAAAAISLGLTSLAGLLISEGFAITISVVLGLALVGSTIVGVPARIVRLLEASALRFAIPSLALFVPLAAFAILVFYPTTFGITLLIGAAFPLEIWIVMGVSALAAIVNIGVFLGNAAATLRSRRGAQHPGS